MNLYAYYKPDGISCKVPLLWYKLCRVERAQLMPQIIPIKDLMDTANVSEPCHNLNEPILITKNGCGDIAWTVMQLP